MHIACCCIIYHIACTVLFHVYSFLALALLCLWLGMFVIVYIRESQTSACRPVREERSVHIFREQPPAQRRVRLSPIESFVLNAATAADEQRHPRKIKSCFYKINSHELRRLPRSRFIPRMYISSIYDRLHRKYIHKRTCETVFYQVQTMRPAHADTV